MAGEIRKQTINLTRERERDRERHSKHAFITCNWCVISGNIPFTQKGNTRRSNLWFPKQRKNLLRKITAKRQDTTPPQLLWRIRKVRTQVVISRQPLRWNETRRRMAPPLFVFYTKAKHGIHQLHLTLLQYSGTCPRGIKAQRQPLSTPNGNFSRRSLTNNSDKNGFLCTYVNSYCIYRRTNKQKLHSDPRHFM